MSPFLLFALTIACSSQTETTESEQKETFKPPQQPHKPIPLSPKMVEIKGQLFKMGKFSHDKKSQRDEKTHMVDFSGVSFMISTTEVTQELYEAVTGINPSKKQNGPKLIVLKLTVSPWTIAWRISLKETHPRN